MSIPDDGGLLRGRLLREVLVSKGINVYGVMVRFTPVYSSAAIVRGIILLERQKHPESGVWICLVKEITLNICDFKLYRKCISNITSAAAKSRTKF